jgi:hypothetical protein
VGEIRPRTEIASRTLPQSISTRRPVHSVSADATSSPTNLQLPIAKLA